jgi:hypothetical protein
MRPFVRHARRQRAALSHGATPKRVSFRAEWSERSERNAVEESRKRLVAWLIGSQLRGPSTTRRHRLSDGAPLGMTRILVATRLLDSMHAQLQSV